MPFSFGSGTENEKLSIKNIDEKAGDEKVVQLLSTGVWVVKGIAQNLCNITFVQRMEDKGKIPKSVLNNDSRSLEVVQQLKRYFERNGLIVDKEVRDVFVKNINETAVITSSVGTEIIQEQVNNERANILPILKFASAHTN